MIITLGNQPSGEDNASIYNLSSTGVSIHEFDMSEQGNHNIPKIMSSGAVVIGGCDAVEPIDEWTFGNIYVKNAGGWTKKRTLPNVLHVFGVTEHNNKIYVGTGAHIGDNATWEARVFWSDDLGDTWTSSYVCYYRVRDLISFSGVLYASCWDWPNYRVYKSIDDGVNWTLVSGITPEPLIRMTIYNNRLLIVDVNLTTIHSLDSNGVDVPLTLPIAMVIPGNCGNYLAVSGTNLYVLTGNRNKIYKYNGSVWTYHCLLPETCCSLLNFEDQFLIAGTLGVNAKILKIPL